MPGSDANASISLHPGEKFSAPLLFCKWLYCDLAIREPVVITKNGRERLVVLGVEQYNLLQLAAEAYEGRKPTSPASSGEPEAKGRKPARRKTVAASQTRK